MSNLFLLILCFFVGAAARRWSALPPDSHHAVNAWVMFVSLPALVFRSIHGAAIDPPMLLAAASLWLVFLVPAAVALWRVRAHPAHAGAYGALALCAGLSNTSFVGFPLMEALAGKEALGPAAVADQFGAFLALYLFAMPFAARLGGQKESALRFLGQLVKKPMVIALMLALVLHGVAIPPSASLVIDRLADMMSPLALASVGWQIDLSALSGNGRRIAVGLSWKLLLAPALVAIVLFAFRGSLGFAEKVMICQAAQAPMVTAGVVASEHKLAPGLSAALIAVGVPLSLVTVPLWWLLLSRF